MRRIVAWLVQRIDRPWLWRIYMLPGLVHYARQAYDQFGDDGGYSSTWLHLGHVLEWYRDYP